MPCVEHHFSINLINRKCGGWIFISAADIRGAGAHYIQSYIRLIATWSDIKFYRFNLWNTDGYGDL